MCVPGSDDAQGVPAWERLLGYVLDHELGIDFEDMLEARNRHVGDLHWLGRCREHYR